MPRLIGGGRTRENFARNRLVGEMLPIGLHVDKVSYTTDGEIVIDDVFQEEHVLLDDWVFVGGKWVRVTKIRYQTDGMLNYYVDGKLVHSMAYADMNQLHKDKSAERPLLLAELVKK